MSAYWQVFFIDEHEDHSVLASDRYSFTTSDSPMLPASGWWELQPHEGLGWSDILHSEDQLYLRISSGAWHEYLRNRREFIAKQDFRQDPFFPGWGSLEQRWSDAEAFGRMRLCSEYQQYCARGGYAVASNGAVFWCPPGTGHGSGGCPYPSW